MKAAITGSEEMSLKQVEAAVLDRLPWLRHPALRFGDNEGYDGRFGVRTGPLSNRTVSNALHEISHAVEMTLLPPVVWKRRSQRHQFEMRVRSYVEIAGERYYEPVTLQPTERECRVGGIQLRLLEAAGFDTSAFCDKFCMTLRWMEDWYMGPGTAPFNVQGELNRQHNSWLNARKRLVVRAHKRHTLEDIQERWTMFMDWHYAKNRSAFETGKPIELARYS